MFVPTPKHTKHFNLTTGKLKGSKNDVVFTVYYNWDQAWKLAGFPIQILNFKSQHEIDFYMMILNLLLYTVLTVCFEHSNKQDFIRMENIVKRFFLTKTKLIHMIITYFPLEIILFIVFFFLIKIYSQNQSNMQKSYQNRFLRT